MKSIAEAARKGGGDQVELEWDSYDKIKQEIVLEQLQWAAEKAKGKEIAKVRAEKARAERRARIVQKRKEQEEKEKARELKREMKEKARQDESVADSQGMKLKQRLRMVRNLRKIARERIKLLEYVLCSHGCHSIELETSSLRRACVDRTSIVCNVSLISMVP